MSRTAWIVVSVVVAVLAADRTGVALPGHGDGSAGEAADAVVTRVVDGDTVKVRMGGGDEDTVRYIGVDTPESVKPGTPVQCFAKRASAFNERLVEGRRVRLRFDAERRDRYGRLLAYVYRSGDDAFVNAALVREGYATTLSIPPDVDHADELRALESRARGAGRGLWSACR